MHTTETRHPGNIEVKNNRQHYYAVVRIGNQVVYTSEMFHTAAAAMMAARAMSERYHDNFEAACLL